MEWFEHNYDKEAIIINDMIVKNNKLCRCSLFVPFVYSSHCVFSQCICNYIETFFYFLNNYRLRAHNWDINTRFKISFVSSEGRTWQTKKFESHPTGEQYLPSSRSWAFCLKTSAKIRPFLCHTLCRLHLLSTPYIFERHCRSNSNY